MQQKEKGFERESKNKMVNPIDYVFYGMIIGIPIAIIIIIDYYLRRRS